MRTNKLLTVIAALQILTLAGQWLGDATKLNSASAQVTDPGKDRAQMLDEMRNTNAKLDKLVEILNSGELQVRVVQSDDNKGKPSAR